MAWPFRVVALRDRTSFRIKLLPYANFPAILNSTTAQNKQANAHVSCRRWMGIKPVKKLGRSATARLVSAVICLHALAACSASDYADGINSFSQAVTQADATERALATAAQQATFNAWIANASARQSAVDFPNWPKCRPPAGSYHPGDCTVKLAGIAAPVVARPTMGSLKTYAAALNAVVADKTCAALQSDATALSTAIGDIAKDARTAAPAVSPVATIVSTSACFAIQTEQIKLLRQATSDANPLVQKLVPLIARTDTQLQNDALDASGLQLQQAYLSYLRSKSSTELRNVVTVAQTLDQAQSVPVGPVIGKLGTLHQTLTTDLASPTISLKRVEADAVSFIASAQSVADSARTLAAPATAKAATTKPAAARTAKTS